MGRPGVVMLAGAVLVTVYLLYGTVRLEPNLQNADDIVWMYMRRKYTRVAAFVGEGLALGHPVNTSRYITSILAPPPPITATDVQISDSVLGGVAVRFYTPENTVKNGPAFIWIHGGGWTSYDVASDDFLCTEFAARLGIVVMSIEYRLAPEWPYPVPFDDCYQATVMFLGTAQKYGVNPDRVAIGGASAGGNLAAAVSLKLRDVNHKHQPRLQILVVPCLQATDFMTPSYQENAHNAMLPKWWMINYWLWYAKGHDGHRLLPTCSTNDHTTAEFKQSKRFTYTSHEHVARKYRDDAAYSPIAANHGDTATWLQLEAPFADPYFAPLMADDVTSLPAAYVITAQYDVLRDDGVLFARRLEKAGVKVSHRHYEGAIHSVLAGFRKYELSKKCMDHFIDFMATHL